MHSCLRIPEILSIILDHLGWVSGRPQETFALLARTCRLFHAPALDRLYRSVFGLAPLIMTMPEDLWCTEGDNMLVRVMFLLCIFGTHHCYPCNDV